MTDYKLHGKVFLEGILEVMTGLAIGGSGEEVEIGGIDQYVIKTSGGVPFIPGSSLKGKIRSLLEQKAGKNICDCGQADCDICAIFGTAAHGDIQSGPTRFYARDAKLTAATQKDMEDKEGIFSGLELAYTESKWENVIDRETSKAQHPRQLERVPAGAEFDYQFLFNIMCAPDIARFKKLIAGLRLLEDDYLGSSGSRGYGRVKFRDFELGVKSTTEYETDNKKESIFAGSLGELSFPEIEDSLFQKLGFDNNEGR